MQKAIDRVMQTYGLLVNLTAEQEQVAPEKVSRFLASAHTSDENKLAVEGLRYLRASSRSADFVGRAAARCGAYRPSHRQ